MQQEMVKIMMLLRNGRCLSTCVDGEMYSLIKSLVTPAKVIDNKYDDVKILQDNANEQ